MSEYNFRISVIGAGYVGLVASACLAKLNNQVICVDNNQEKIASLKKLIIPNYEPGLEDLVKQEVEGSRRLSFGDDISQTVRNSEIIFIAVGTPSRPNGEPDLSAVERVSREIALNLNSYKLIVEKSTVPVQTGLKIKETIKRYRKQEIDFDVASNPEFLREGRAIQDFLYPDRIVIGVESERAKDILTRLYTSLKAPILITDINTAELIKHASNSFLATKISFINAVSVICERTGADIKKVAEGMGLDKRIGRDFLEAGVGFGGSCFPKDVEAFIHIAKEVGYDFQLLKEVKRVNSYQRQAVIKKLKEGLWVLNEKVVGVLGLSFKPDTDDIRESPALEIIRLLKEEGTLVKAYDPKAIPKAKEVLDGVFFSSSPYQALEGADGLILVTAWKEFKELDFLRIKNLMRYPLVIDGRNMWDKEVLERLGFIYKGIGV